MPATPVTTDPQHSVLLTAEQVDSTGAVLATQDSSYGAPVFESSNTASVVINPGNRAVFGGTLGSSTITATSTSTDSTKPVLTNTVEITFQGPPAAGLQINSQVVEGN